MTLKEKRKAYQKEYKNLKKKFKHAYKKFKPWDYSFNFELFLESLRLTKTLWSYPDLLFQDTSCSKDPEMININNFQECFKALERAVELGDKIINCKCISIDDENNTYNEFWDILKAYFRTWWD